MSLRSCVSGVLSRRGGAIVASTLTVGVLLVSAGQAGAVPQPTVGQVRQQLSRLMSRQDTAVQAYDQVAQELVSARQRLALINREVAANRTRFDSMRTQIARIATAAYENGTITSPAALLTTSNPDAILSQASVLEHLSSNTTAEMNQIITAAREVTQAQQASRRIEAAVAALDKQRLVRKRAITAAVAKQRALLARLTGAQQAAALPGSTGATTGTYTGPTTTQAQKAIAFAYAQLGKPYVWGATGPSSYDCSGLMQAAWAAAGVAIPRTTYEQWAALPHVPMSAIQPGDLIFFDGEGHVSIYVGSNMIIDAPQPGEFVEKVSLSSPWYSSTLDGAVRP